MARSLGSWIDGVGLCTCYSFAAGKLEEKSAAARLVSVSERAVEEFGLIYYGKNLLRTQCSCYLVTILPVDRGSYPPNFPWRVSVAVNKGIGLSMKPRGPLGLHRPSPHMS